jgi:hypothetical protein
VRLSLLVAAALAGTALGGTVPYPVYNAVRGRVVAWQPARQGYAVAYLSGAPRGWCGFQGGAWHLALVRNSSTGPSRVTVDRRLEGSMCGNELVWLRAGRLTDGQHAEVALSILTTPSIGATAWVFRVVAGRFALVRRFYADRIAIRPGVVTLTWLLGHSPDGTTTREVWRFTRGAYRLVAKS